MSTHSFTLAPGARVQVRDEEWLVRQVRPSSSGGKAVHVTGLSELVRDRDAIFLTNLDEIVELKPEDTELVHDDSPRYRRARLYLDALLRRTPPTDARLYAGHLGAMRPSHYQLVPAALALSRPRPRILIADAVGLGKTIEVGVLLSELIRRGRGDRILVIALKSVLAQFQEELWARFTIPLVRLDSVGIQRVRSKIPSNMNPFYHFDRVIISIDTLKRDEKYRKFLEECRWDAIVIDECQHVAVRSSAGTRSMSQRARLAKLLADTTDALIMTSATPHDGRPESFASLMNLLEPTAVANPSDYTREDIRGLYVRRFKKDVAHEAGSAFHPRQLEKHQIQASDAEDRAFEELHASTFQTIDRRSSSADVLFRTTLLKALLSSPAACRSTCANRLAKLDRQAERDPTDSAIDEDRDTLLGLIDTLDAIAPKDFGKLQQLVSLMRELGWGGRGYGERMVIFSERIDTLRYLQEQLCATFGLKEEQVPLFHGMLGDQEQQALVKDFGTEKGRVKILLGSDAASEGINLHHYCHWLVHFDIPWSLITLEQRNGRIDRFGQEHPPMIRYLLTKPGREDLRGDLRVLDRLIEKEQAAHLNLGDVAWLMNLHDASEEETRVALGIQNSEEPEAVIPDLPTANFFAQLEALANEDDEESEDEVSAKIEDLMNAGNLDGESGEHIEVEQAPSLSLFPSTLDYAREAFAQLHDNNPEEIAFPDWKEDLSGFILEAPDDLRRRYDYLPDELTSRGWFMRLTADRELVQDAYKKSREDEGSWPEWELFWDMHPVAEWLNDRVLGMLSRHEAATVHVDRGLEAGEVVYLFQGQLSNKRSQPVLVDWFGVSMRSGEEPRGIIGIEDLIVRCGLDRELPNPNKVIDTAPLSEALPAAVVRAREHMSTVRRERGDRMRESLKDEFRRVKQWKDRALDGIDEQEANVAAARTVRADERRRFEQQREDIERRSKALNAWLDEGLSTIDEPYIRLAMVLIRE